MFYILLFEFYMKKLSKVFKVFHFMFQQKLLLLILLLRNILKEDHHIL